MSVFPNDYHYYYFDFGMIGFWKQFDLSNELRLVPYNYRPWRGLTGHEQEILEGVDLASNMTFPVEVMRVQSFFGTKLNK